MQEKKYCWIELLMLNNKAYYYITVQIKQLVWFGLVWFGLVWFYGIPTIVDQSMPNPFYTYLKYTIFKYILKITFLNRPGPVSFAQLNGLT